MAIRSKILLLFLLLPILSFGAVTFQNVTSTGTVGTYPTTMTLPTVSNGGVILLSTVPIVEQAADPAFRITSSDPWISMCNYGYYGTWYRVWHTGDSTSVTVDVVPGAPNSLGQTIAGVSYSGTDTTNPVDGFSCNHHTGRHWTFPVASVAPSTAALWTNEMAVNIFMQPKNGGGCPAFGTPSGYTQRTYTSPTAAGYIEIDDKLLTSGINTGDQIGIPCPNGGLGSFGMTVLLKPATGTTSTGVNPTPALASTDDEINVSGSGTTYDYAILYPHDGDLVSIAFINCGGSFSLTGFNTLVSVTGLSIFTRTWTTGTTTIVNVPGSCEWFTGVYRNYRYVCTCSAAGQLVTPDTYEYTNSVTGTQTLSTMSLASVNEYLTMWYWDVTAAPRFGNVTGSVANPHINIADNIWVGGGNPTDNANYEWSIPAPANPTGTFSATNLATSSDTIWAAMVAYKFGPTNTRVPHKTTWIDQN